MTMARGAYLSDESPTPRYRYTLWRRWDTALPQQIWIMLNPSTADAALDDATIRLCVERARQGHFGCITVVNLYAYRTKSPSILWAAAGDGVDIVGPENERVVLHMLWQARAGTINYWPGVQIICAWGGDVRGDRPQRVLEQARELKVPLYALRLTKAGAPCHPLRIPYSETPFLWQAAA